MHVRKQADSVSRRVVAGLARELTAIQGLSIQELRERFEELYGRPTTSRNKRHLQKRVAWRIQELEHGGLSERAKARLKELEEFIPDRWRLDRPRPEPKPKKAEAKGRDPRLPEPGTVLRREYQGTQHHVTVLDEGFEYRGMHYQSLSQIAKRITGTTWNGWLFFRLQSRARGKKA